MLSPSRKSHRKVFVGACDDMLGIMDVENELPAAAEGMSRSKMEQIDKVIARILQKSRRKVE